MLGHESKKGWSGEDFWYRRFQLIQTTVLQNKQREYRLHGLYTAMFLCMQLQVLLEWSKERYAARFTVYGDNIGGRSYERL